MTTAARTKAPTGFLCLERERDDRNAYWVKITQCFYHSYFVAHGAPETYAGFLRLGRELVVRYRPSSARVPVRTPDDSGLRGGACYFRNTRELTTGVSES